jgi:hypothetical protein
MLRCVNLAPPFLDGNYALIVCHYGGNGSQVAETLGLSKEVTGSSATPGLSRSAPEGENIWTRDPSHIGRS